MYIDDNDMPAEGAVVGIALKTPRGMSLHKLGGVLGSGDLGCASVL